MIYFNGSYEQFVKEALDHEPPENANSSRRGGNDFASKSWEEAVELAVNGDVKLAGTLSSDVLNIAEAIRHDVLPRYDVEYHIDDGVFVDVARFVSGEPECLARFVESGKTPGRSVSIAVNMTYRCGVKARDIAKLGGRIAGLILGLISSGVDVKVYLYFAEKGDAGPTVAQEVIQCPSMDLSKIAAAFTPYFFRRIAFSWFEMQSEEHREAYDIVTGRGYGSVQNVDCELKTDICIKNPESLFSDQAWQKLVNDVKSKLRGGK